MYVVSLQSPHGTTSSSSSSDRDLEAALGRERAKWAQECLSTQQALLEAERQIAQLKLDLERGSLRRDTSALNGDTTEQQQQQKVSARRPHLHTPHLPSFNPNPIGGGGGFFSPPPVVFFAVHLDRLEFHVQTS